VRVGAPTPAPAPQTGGFAVGGKRGGDPPQASSRPTVFPGSYVWDEKRNTSRVWPVPPDALPTALRELARWRDRNDAHARWIADGYPTLTEREHLERFGEPYRAARSRRSAS